jgi:hypothetical protein
MGGPLDRTWFNALVDDTGTGTTGTIWNKAQLANELNSIDSALAPLAVGPASSVAGNVPSFADATGKVLSDSGLKFSALLNVPFNAANFVGVGGTWTVTAGNVAIFQYALAGHVGFVTLYLTGSTVTGTPSQLQILNLPFTPQATVHIPIWATAVPPAWKVIDLYVSGGTNAMYLWTDPASSTNWAAGTVNVMASVTLAL